MKNHSVKALNSRNLNAQQYATWHNVDRKIAGESSLDKRKNACNTRKHLVVTFRLSWDEYKRLKLLARGNFSECIRQRLGGEGGRGLSFTATTSDCGGPFLTWVKTNEKSDEPHSPPKRRLIRDRR
ncbi:MAG: hypothetical protein QW175_04895 [Candidatus Bathyarchaeia archaeon]